MKCSALNNGTHFEMMKTRLGEIVRDEKKRRRSIWPCLSARTNLSVLKMIIVNIRLCYQELQPIMEKMHEKFAENMQKTTDILKWLERQFKKTSYWATHSWFLATDGIVVGLERKQERNQLEEMLGPKCYKRLTKRCRCVEKDIA